MSVCARPTCAEICDGSIPVSRRHADFHAAIVWINIMDDDAAGTAETAAAALADARAASWGCKTPSDQCGRGFVVPQAFRWNARWVNSTPG